MKNDVVICAPPVRTVPTDHPIGIRELIKAFLSGRNARTIKAYSQDLADYSRHSRKSVAILMVYRDRERNVQGQLASLVSNAV